MQGRISNRICLKYFAQSIKKMVKATPGDVLSQPFSPAGPLSAGLDRGGAAICIESYTDCADQTCSGVCRSLSGLANRWTLCLPMNHAQAANEEEDCLLKRSPSLVFYVMCTTFASNVSSLTERMSSNGNTSTLNLRGTRRLFGVPLKRVKGA